MSHIPSLITVITYIIYRDDGGPSLLLGPKDYNEEGRFQPCSRTLHSDLCLNLLLALLSKSVPHFYLYIRGGLSPGLSPLPQFSWALSSLTFISMLS